MSGPTLPPAATREAFLAAREQSTRLREAVAALAREQGWSSAVPERFDEGSLPVFALGNDLVVKLFPPAFPEDAVVERAALEALAGRLPVATPIVQAHGVRDDWTWLAMDRLPGWPLDQVWPSIPREQQLALMRSLGHCLKVLHRVPLGTTAILHPHWPTWMAEQRARVRERQAAKGLPERWLEGLEPFLDSVELPTDVAPVFLHTEIMAAHVLALPTGGTWRLSGLLDFEPAMAGAPEYELASVGLFVTEGDPFLFDAVLEGYGLPPEARDESLQRRCLAYALLHTYANLPWFLDRLGEPPEGPSYEALARRWWALPTRA
ncbi:MAG: phosphotransferase family protein [Planctomycetota bacterium]